MMNWVAKAARMIPKTRETTADTVAPSTAINFDAARKARSVSSKVSPKAPKMLPCARRLPHGSPSAG